jgi:hypothetical protein
MRQLLAPLLSLGALILLAVTAPAAEVAAASADRGIQLAQQELARVKELVDLGALPRARLEDAQAKLEDAKDEVIVAHDLYGDLPEQGASEQASAEMIAAAERRFERQNARIEEARKMVDAGVVAKTYLAPFEAELASRQTTLDLARLRAHLMADRAAMIQQQPKVPPVFVPAPTEDTEFLGQGEEHYEGAGEFNEPRDLPALELAFSNKFGRPLPISAEGETEVHRALGFDHRGRVDVAVTPDEAEGIWLRQYLQARKIPYYAFSRAIPGKATAAHIHIGPGSTRLSNQLSKRQATRTHSAD